ncbi:unnamed protein product [Ilex paraguariensis]|uniref:F-box domain-containing protein n=1 Tax=Ilex paraguariensis TaxID=185542 RepID=A0ABC8UTH9_9AQUA
MDSVNPIHQEEEEDQDQFDRLPDALVLLIFNKLQDAKSLCRCILLCKRFGSIVSETQTISITIPRRNSIPINNKNIKPPHDHQNSRSNPPGHLHKGFFKSVFNWVAIKPLQFLLQIIKAKSSSYSLCAEGNYEDFYYSPNEVLSRFKEVRSMQIELPGHGGELGSNSRDTQQMILKWQADFGSKLHSCVLLGATSFHQKLNRNGEEESQEQENETPFTDEELKLRVVWTISTLIAASARHYLLQKVILEHPMLENVVITDGSKQGTVCMKKEQIVELRKAMEAKMESPATALERSRVPALKMKLWYVSELELPETGKVMEGATLVSIRPVERWEVAESGGDTVVEGLDFDRWDEEARGFGEAARMMVKRKKTCTLEMSSF